MLSRQWLRVNSSASTPLKGNKFLSDELGRGARHRRSFDSNMTIWILNYCYAYAGCTLVHPWVCDSWPRELLCFALSRLFPSSRLIFGSLHNLSCTHYSHFIQPQEKIWEIYYSNSVVKFSLKVSSSYNLFALSYNHLTHALFWKVCIVRFIFNIYIKYLLNYFLKLHLTK